GRLRARPDGRLGAGRPPSARGSARGPEPARTRGARPDGRGPLERGDRAGPLRDRARCREARHEHLPEAPPARERGGPPPRARCAALPQRVDMNVGVPVTGLYEAHLTVSDLHRSEAFYRDVVGLEQALEVPDRSVAFFWVGGARETMLGLWS